MTVTAEQAERFAAYLEAAKASVLRNLEAIRQEVTGDPAALERRAELYRAQSEHMQRTYELVGVQSRALDRNWGGSAYQQARDGFREMTGRLRSTVRGMNAERARLFRDAAALREARPGVDQVIATFEAGAQALINEARAQGNQMGIIGRWQRLVETSFRQAWAIRAKLAGVLAQPAELPEHWWRTLAGRRLESLLGGSTTRPATTSGHVPDLGLDPQATEFSHSVSSLTGRMNSDALSSHAEQLRSSAYLDRFMPWARLVGPGGAWDLKAYYDQMWGMGERNNFHIPLPPEVGTVNGRPVEIDRDLLGNIHYGYVGASIGGFPPWGATAAVGANGADIAFHGRTDPGDQIGVRIGRDLYERFPIVGQQITPQHVSGLNQAVIDALRTNFDELVRTGKIRVR
jgi:hypothetical protein